jgi:hypothetical protein
MVCAAGCWQRAELRIAGAAAQTRGVSAEFGCMVLRFGPRPLAIPLRTKRNLPAVSVPGYEHARAR